MGEAPSSNLGVPTSLGFQSTLIGSPSYLPRIHAEKRGSDHNRKLDSARDPTKHPEVFQLLFLLLTRVLPRSSALIDLVFQLSDYDWRRERFMYRTLMRDLLQTRQLFLAQVSFKLD